MPVLYRKYRPQTFLQVLNQKPIIQTLKNQVAGGSVAHAYLFTGSRGVGKTSVARILAKAVNCQGIEPSLSFAALKTSPPEGEKNIVRASPDALGDACGQCSVCKQIEQGNFIDLVEVDAASNTGVDNIRELIEYVKFSPTIGKYKVFIIDEVHMLSKGAFNALLKTLEEPPRHAIFILATTEINKVPATIVSRTQRFDFKALSAADLLGHLQKISQAEGLKFTPDILNLVAQNAEGSVRDALSLLDKISTLGNEVSLAEGQQLLGITDIGMCENLLNLIAAGQAGQMPEFFSGLAEKGLDYLIFNRDFLEYLRKNLIYKITEGKVDFALAEERWQKLKAFSQKFQVQDLIFTIRLFLKSFKDLNLSPSPEIPLLLAGIEAAVKRAESGDRKSKATENPAADIDTGGSPPAQVKQPSVQTEEMEVQETPRISSSQEISPAQAPVLDLAEAENLWPKVVAKVKEINGPLGSMLKNCRLDSVAEGKIVVAVKFVFDKHSLENAKNSSLIVSVIEEISGKKIGISAQVIRQEVRETATAGNLSDALKVFGGELIE